VSCRRARACAISRRAARRLCARHAPPPRSPAASRAPRSQLTGAQPFVLETDLGMLAIAHNGQLARQEALRKIVLARGTGLFTTSDSELIAQTLARPHDVSLVQVRFRAWRTAATSAPWRLAATIALPCRLLARNRRSSTPSSSSSRPPALARSRC